MCFHHSTFHHFFPSQVFSMLNRLHPPAADSEELAFHISLFSQRVLTSNKPDQISQPHSSLFTIWLGININKFTFIFNTCERNRASFGWFRGGWIHWNRNHMRRNQFLSFAHACCAALLGQDTSEPQQAWFLQLEFLIPGEICGLCHACVT